VQFSFCAHDRGLFGKKFLPAKTEVPKLLLEREPGAFMPAQAIVNRIAILHERFFHFFAHLRGGRSAERRHLAVPARPKLPTLVCQASQRVQCAKMLEQSRACSIYLCRINKLVPGFVRKQRKGTEFAALFEMAQDFRGDAQ
jgi:hypothetical protein